MRATLIQPRKIRLEILTQALIRQPGKRRLTKVLRRLSTKSSNSK